jgi:hypothetical protein
MAESFLSVAINNAGKKRLQKKKNKYKFGWNIFNATPSNKYKEMLCVD